MVIDQDWHRTRLQIKLSREIIDGMPLERDSKAWHA